MKRALAAVLLVAASLALAIGDTANLSVTARHALTSIDTVPTKKQLDHAFMDQGGALTNLSAIAQDTTIDIGVRVRAIHGLGKYCTDPCTTDDLAHESLTALINATRNETVGETVVLLRAAVETIGVLKVQDDYLLLVQLLDHASRDIRAATARALRDLCNSQASSALRVRFTSEPTEQVKLAISEALRILGQCGT